MMMDISKPFRNIRKSHQQLFSYDDEDERRGRFWKEEEELFSLGFQQKLLILASDNEETLQTLTKTEIKIKILKEKQSAYLHIVITGGKTKNR